MEPPNLYPDEVSVPLELELDVATALKRCRFSAARAAASFTFSRTIFTPPIFGADPSNSTDRHQPTRGDGPV